MDDVTIFYLAWAVTATIAAGYYGYHSFRHKFILVTTLKAMRLIAKGEATVTIDRDDNMRIKSND